MDDTMNIYRNICIMPYLSARQFSIEAITNALMS